MSPSLLIPRSILRGNGHNACLLAVEGCLGLADEKEGAAWSCDRNEHGRIVGLPVPKTSNAFWTYLLTLACFSAGITAIVKTTKLPLMQSADFGKPAQKCPGHFGQQSRANGLTFVS